MYSAILSSKFQICIPKQLREELHITAGQEFVFIPHGNSIQLVMKRDLASMRGIMAGSDQSNIRDREDRS